MVRCRCKGGSKLLPCCRRYSRGRSFNSRNTSRNTPSRSRRGVSLPDPRSSGTASRRMQKIGKTLEQIGLAQFTNSYRSMPASSGKIWMAMSRKDAATHAPAALKNSKKYDWQPKGESINWETKNSPTFDPGQKKLRGREAHWARRPKYNQGIYSQPTVSEISHHRKSQRRRGQTKMAVGTSLRLLGNGLLVYQFGNYAYWLYEDPSDETAVEIINDLTMYDEIKTYIINPIIDYLDPTQLSFSAD